MLKAFSPGARTPPPESVSRWSYHVSCLFHRHSHTAGEIPVYGARGPVPPPNRSSESFALPRDSTTLAKLSSYWGKFFQRSFSYFIPHFTFKHALNFSRLSVLLVRPFVRKSALIFFFIDECRPMVF